MSTHVFRAALTLTESMAMLTINISMLCIASIGTRRKRGENILALILTLWDRRHFDKVGL
jgi:hypothetical protein